MDPKVLEKTTDDNGQLYIGVTVVLKMKGYDFFFCRQPDDFAPDSEFVPFFWRRKGNDPDDEEAGKDKDKEGNDDLGRLAEAQSVNMDVDATHVSGDTHGRTVAAIVPSNTLMDVTPFNPFPKTPRAKEIVEAARLRSSGLIAQVSPLSTPVPICHAVCAEKNSYMQPLGVLGQGKEYYLCMQGPDQAVDVAKLDTVASLACVHVQHGSDPADVRPALGEAAASIPLCRFAAAGGPSCMDGLLVRVDLPAAATGDASTT
jgi:hypothetical protein